MLQYSNQPESINTEKTDIWSYGMFLIELLTLEAPYHNKTEQEMVNLILKGILPDSIPKTSRAVDLIKKCCSLDPANRPTAAEILSLLNPLS